MEIPLKDITLWFMEVEQQIEKTEVKEIKDFLHGEQHAYVRILRKYGKGKEFQDFKRKWCEDHKIDPVSMRCLMDN